MIKNCLAILVPMLLLAGAGCQSVNVDQTQTSQKRQEKMNLTQNSDVIEATPAKIALPDQALVAAFKETASHSAMADIAELACFPQSRFNCNADGCVSLTPATYFFVDYGTEAGTYFRCDAKGCDPYRVNAVPSGIYTQFIPSGGQAMLFKVTTDDAIGTKGDFVDVATIGTTTVVSFGKCQ